MITFILNNKRITTDKPEGMVLLDYIRYEQVLMGTKTGCREGDCGACTVLEGSLQEGTVVYKSILSCLTPLGNIQGKHIVTIEGLEKENLSPVQQAMTDRAATQCGFCTPGFILSMTAHSLKNEPSDKEKTLASISGNICRCTGYKSIEKAAEDVNNKLNNKDLNNHTDWLVRNGFVPEYFLEIADRLKDIVSETKTGEKGITVGGGTDLFVQKADALFHSNLHFLQNDPEFSRIEVVSGVCHIGAAVTAEAIMNNSLLQKHFPHLKEHFKLVSSEPVRNMGTLAGNVINASPIADLVIMFLAMDSTVHLQNKGKYHRNVPLRDFYKGYKQMDIYPDEVIEKLSFRLPENHRFNFEKVSKRTHLDIASVNTAILIEEKMGIISNVHLSAGGVFPYPFYSRKTIEFLTGKPLNAEIIREASKVLTGEIAPISDIRGTLEYKRLLLRQLFFAHFIRLFPEEVSFTELIEQPAKP